MIHHISGNLYALKPTYAVIECAGVGYGLHISLRTYSQLSDKQNVTLYVEALYSRDDLPKTYGFFEEQERELFRKLVSVSGVGGNSALLLLSSLSPLDIETAINTANVSLLKTIKGIGEKTAQRIVVDLKGKLGKHEGGIGMILATAHTKTQDEALLALMTLGFNKSAAEKAIERALRDGLSNETKPDIIIKSALKFL